MASQSGGDDGGAAGRASIGSRLALAEADLKDAIENRESARLEFERAVAQLNQRTLTSPFDGIVVERMLNPGDLAESGTGRKPMLKLAQIDPLRVEVVLPLSAMERYGSGPWRKSSLRADTRSSRQK